MSDTDLAFRVYVLSDIINSGLQIFRQVKGKVSAKDMQDQYWSNLFIFSIIIHISNRKTIVLLKLSSLASLTYY